MNVQCLRNKLLNLEVFCQERKLDIICIQEHWCTEENIKCMYIPGYTLTTSFTRSNKIHGGSLIFVSTKTLCKSGVIDCSRSSEENTYECCAIYATYENSTFLIINVYRTPDSNLDTFLEKCFSLLTKHSNRFDKICICGDFNIDYLTLNNDKNLLDDLFDSYGLKLGLPNEPTRIVARGLL